MYSRFLLGALVLAFDMLSIALPAYGQTVSERADALVQELGQFRASLPATARSDGSTDPVEDRRHRVYAQLRDLGDQALPALSRGLVDPEVQIRRNVALFLGVTSGGWFTFNPPQPKFDIRASLPALISALKDGDPRVRGLSAQAIGNIGPNAAPAVPELITLLASTDEGSRISACIGLYGIGPAAREALPALRKALTDPSTDVRRSAQRAIDKIEAPR